MQQCKHCHLNLSRNNLWSEREQIVYRDWQTDTDHLAVSAIPEGHESSEINMVIREYLCPFCAQTSEFVYRWRKLKPERNLQAD
jgi:acetone carboxylase gamma subunit